MAKGVTSGQAAVAAALNSGDKAAAVKAFEKLSTAEMASINAAALRKLGK